MSDKDFPSSLVTMEGGCNLATDSSGKRTLANPRYQQMDLKGKLSESLIKNSQQGGFSDDIDSRTNELHSERPACWVKGPYDDSQHGTRCKLPGKYTKEPQTLPQSDRNVYRCLDKQMSELLQSILARTELKKDECGVCTIGPKATAAMSLHGSPDRNLDLENFMLDLRPSKTVHLAHSCCVHPEVKSAVVKVTHKPSQATSANKPMEKDSDRSLSVKGNQVDFFEPLMEKLQQKELEKQQLAALLLMEQEELRDVKEMLRLKEMEVQLMAEKLRCEEQTNFQAIQSLNNVCEDMKKKLCIAKNNNESFAKQLKALLEKYERLKKRADTIKGQLLEERTKKRSSQKAVKEMQKMAEELLVNQAVLEKQREAAARELAACKKNMEKEQKKHIKMVQSVEEETSVIRAEYEGLGDELRKTQEENKKLTGALQSKQLEQKRAEENLLESQNAIKQLHTALDESKAQEESASHQLEAMKKEIKLIHNKQNEERLQLQEQSKTCMKQCEDMRVKCEALNEVVTKLQTEKRKLKEQLQRHQKEKAKSETASKQEGEKLRETIGLLERERELLLEEMKDLRKDYFSLSDRITQRLGRLDQTDAPMCITDISSFHQKRAPNEDNTIGPVTPSMDMIQHIRKKLEEEENTQHERIHKTLPSVH